MGTSPLTILAPADVPGFLAPLPVEALDLGEDATDHLHLVGLHTLGTLAALPRGALGDYLGPLGAAVEALARGEDARPLAPRRPALILRARRDLDWPLADRAMLAALVARLLAPGLAQLAHQGLGATRATLRLTAGGRTIRVVARLPAPTAAAPALLAALLGAADRALDQSRGEGDTDDPDGAAGELGITAVALALVAPRPLPARQSSFFDVPQGRLAQLHAGFAEARRRGDSPIGFLRPVAADHPRREFRYALDPEALPPTGEAAS